MYDFLLWTNYFMFISFLFLILLKSTIPSIIVSASCIFYWSILIYLFLYFSYSCQTLYSLLTVNFLCADNFIQLCDM